jgi:hypothetical protein
LASSSRAWASSAVMLTASTGEVGARSGSGFGVHLRRLPPPCLRRGHVRQQ